jgi:hypothetical protein
MGHEHCTYPLSQFVSLALGLPFSKGCELDSLTFVHGAPCESHERNLADAPTVGATTTIEGKFSCGLMEGFRFN